MTELGSSAVRFTRAILLAMLLGILLDLLLIAFAALSSDSPLTMPGGIRSVAEAAAPLLVCGFVLLHLIRGRLVRGDAALRLGAFIGIVGGLVLVTHMALEDFGNRIGENAVVTLICMCCGFVIWGVAGFWAVRETGQLKSGIVAGGWSAMIGVVMAVTFGLVMMTANIPSPAYVATWPEFKQSGWTNAHAFAIANCMEAVLGHLIVGPVAGMILGFVGGGIAQVTVRRSLTVPER